MPDTERSCSIENVTGTLHVPASAVGIFCCVMHYAAVVPEHQLVGHPLRALDGLRSGSCGGAALSISTRRALSVMPLKPTVESLE